MKRDYKGIFFMVLIVAIVIALFSADIFFSKKDRENATNNEPKSSEVESESKSSSSKSADTKSSDNSDDSDEAGNSNDLITTNRDDIDIKATELPVSTPAAVKAPAHAVGQLDRDFIVTDYDDANEAYNNSYNEAYKYCENMKAAGIDMVMVEVYINTNNFLGYGCRENVDGTYSNDPKSMSMTTPLNPELYE